MIEASGGSIAYLWSKHMDTRRHTTVIRVKRADRAERKSCRVADDIRTDGYRKALETLKPVRINQNRGVI